MKQPCFKTRKFSCLIYDIAMSHTWMSHVAHSNTSCCTQIMRHGARLCKRTHLSHRHLDLLCRTRVHDMTHCCMRHDSFICVTDAWHDSFICVADVWHDSPTCDRCVTWLVHMSGRCVTWLIYVWRMRDMTHPCVWQTHDMTHPCVADGWHDSFMCVTDAWHDSFMCVTDAQHDSLIYVGDTWHDSLLCEMWVIRMRDMAHSHLWNVSTLQFTCALARSSSLRCVTIIFIFAVSYECMYICKWVCVYICLHVYKYTYKYLCLYVYMCSCNFVRSSSLRCVTIMSCLPPRVYVCTDVSKDQCIHVCMYASFFYMHVRM